jgi:cyclic-di-GMP phosphodiesterase TipF (flagellum assembly factor)
MRILILALLTGAYVCAGLIVWLLVWQNGGGVPAGFASFIGTLGLAFAFHSLFARLIDSAALRQDIHALREAHLILADQIEKVDARLTEIVETVTDEALRRSDELTSEVHVLEDMVQRMSERLEDQLLYHVEAAHETRVSDQSAVLLDTVHDALAGGRVDLYLQPSVSLPQRRTVFYESFSRLRDETGRVLMPAEYLAVAEPEGLVAAIDNLLLFRCVQIVRRLARQDRKVGIFCNLSLASLADEVFFPQFMEFLTANRDLAGALIFELGQAGFNARGAVEARNMGKLADLGFRFSLDKVSDFDLDFQDLARADVKFVKIAAQVLLDQLVETDGGLAFKSLPDLQASDYAALCRRYGVEIIAEKVETERQAVDILELDIAYGQGNLFGEPRAIRDAVLAETAPPAEFLRQSLQRRAAGGY